MMMTSATGPKIPYRGQDLPPKLLPEGMYSAFLESAEYRYGKYSGRPYILIRCRILAHKYANRIVYYTYSIWPGPCWNLPKNEQECKEFKPRTEYIAIKHVHREGAIYEHVRGLL